MYIKMFEAFQASKKGETDSYDSPEYVVQPAPNDKGFFMFKSEFDKLKDSKKKNKKKYSPSISWRFADDSQNI